MLREELDRPHRVVREESPANGAVEDGLEEFKVVIDCGNLAVFDKAGLEVLHILRRDVHCSAAPKELCE
jgi:hypothetical protein